MKKSKLKNIIRHVIREQRDIDDRGNIDDFDRDRERPEAAPPPGCVANGGMIITFQKCIGNNMFTNCCATLNNTTPTTSNIGELVDLPNASPPGWYKIYNVVNPTTQPNHNLSQLCAPNMGTPINFDTIPAGPCPPPNPACANFNNMICGECMNHGGYTQQYLEYAVNNYNYYAGHAFWWILSNPGRSNGAYYHEIVFPGGECECCHDPVANPCQGQGCNTPPSDWNQPFNPPMTPVCLHPNDSQYQVGYPCDCWTNNTGACW